MSEIAHVHLMQRGIAPGQAGRCQRGGIASAVGMKIASPMPSTIIATTRVATTAVRLKSATRKRANPIVHSARTIAGCVLGADRG